MENPNPTHLQQQPRFTSPEMEAAMHLIQLSGESDVDVHCHGFSNCNSSGEVLPMKRTRNKFDCDRDESQGSSTSDVTSGPVNVVVRRFEAEDDGGDGNGVAGSVRAKKKFRSIVEIYKISRPLF